MKPLSFLLTIITLLLIFSCSFNEQEYSPYINSVYEYVYGVGQHAHEVSYGENEHMKGQTSDIVLLGGWGGYIVAGFDHKVMNRLGFYDLAIFAQGGVGDEPAVIFVMKDVNNDGLPNDTWYEIGGSEIDENGYQRGATVSYYKQDDHSLSMFYTINGENTQHELIEGYGGNTSSTWWWPMYDTLNDDKYHAITKGSDSLGSFILFSGTLLPNSKVENGGNWDDILGRFTYGYGENYSGEDYSFVPFGRGKKGANLVDIRDAIDSNGDFVELEYINFIKIQTGVLQVCGWLNEVSSEIAGAADLNLIEGDWSR